MRRLAATAVLGLLLAAGVAPADASRVPEESEIIALSPQMGRFLARRIRPGQVRQVRLQTLIDVIFSPDGLEITYGNSSTRTAEGTFKARNGNCLSFTVMFVAMARHLGLNAYFREVDEVTSWDQRGNLVVTGRHMYAEVEADNGLTQVDFLPGTGKLYRSTRRIRTPRVYAHFYSNLGVERLTTGRAAEAVALFERALANDARFSQALVNLGVAYRRLGDDARAEASFLRALEVDAGEMAAATNLAALYLSRGRLAEAEPWLERVGGYLRRNPFHHFRLGLRAAGQDDPEAAIAHLREAIRRRPEEAFFHLELARLQLRLGRQEQARSSLERALALASGEEERRPIRAFQSQLDSTL